MIILRAPWTWIWGGWHFAWLLGLLWSGVAYAQGLDPEAIRLYFAALYTVFWPIELVGLVYNLRSSDHVARTLSEFRQYIPVTFGKGPSGVGWKALGYTGVIDGLIVGWLFYPVNRGAGAVIGTIVALWLTAHFGWRERVG